MIVAPLAIRQVENFATDAGGVTYADSKLTTTTTYTRDNLGRVTATNISGTDLLSAGQGAFAYDVSSVPNPTANFEALFDLPNVTQDSYGHPTTTAYHPFLGLPSSVTDANGEQVTTSYDALGRPLVVTDVHKQLVTTKAYAWTSASASDWTKTQTVTDPADSAHALPSVYAVNTSTTVQPTVTAYYDRLGRVIRTIKNGFNDQQIFTDTVYDVLGRVTASSLPYLSNGTPQWTITVYDPLGRVSRVTAPNGTVTDTKYLGRITQVSVDAVDLGGVNPPAQINTTQVDAQGHTIAVWNDNNPPILTTIPGSDVAATSSTTPSIAFTLDGFGRMLTTTLKDQSQTITATYDALGRQTQLVDPDKGTWNYANSALGHVLTQKDTGDVHITSSVFDQLGRPLSRTINGGTGENANFYYYDTSDIVNAFPAAHLIPQGAQGIPQGAQGWIGAPEREECTATGSYATTNLHYYDSFGRPALELAQTDGKWFYTYSDYDVYSRVRQVRHYWKPSGSEDPGNKPYLWQVFGYIYSYDNQSYLVSLTDSLGRSWWDSPKYDYMDRVVEVRKGSGLVTKRTYGPTDGTLTAITTGTNGSVQNLGFVFDGLGNLTQRTDANATGGTENLVYDDLNRLTSSKQGATAYDPNGNIRTKDGVDGPVAITDYDSAHPHAVSAYTYKTAQSFTVTYDANGNLLTRSAPAAGTTMPASYTTVNWTGFDKPRWMAKTSSALSGGSQSAVGSEFHYNANRSRVMQLEFNDATTSGPTKYNRKRIYALGSTLELNYTTTTPALSPNWTLDTVRIYVPGPDGIIGAREFRPAELVGGVPSPREKALVYHYDHLGSITAITNLGDASGALAADGNSEPGKYSEDAWGQRRDPIHWTGAANPAVSDDGHADSLTPRGFTSHEMLDDLGLVHMNGRIYDPLLGRFLSAAILVQNPGSLQSYNRYSYVGNNPLSLVDPSGFEAGIAGGTPSNEEMKRKLAEEEKKRSDAYSKHAQQVIYGGTGAADRIIASFDSSTTTGNTTSSAANQAQPAATPAKDKVADSDVKPKDGSKISQDAPNSGAWGAALDSGNRYAGAVLENFKFWKWPQNIADFAGSQVGSVIYDTENYFGLDNNLAYLKQQFGTAEGWGGMLGAGLVGSVVPQVRVPALTTSDGFLFGGLKVNAPFDIPVQRFGRMSLDRPDFWGVRIGSGEFANRTFAAIKAEWNPLTNYTQGVIPRGTPITFGLIGPQGWQYPGGSLQFTIGSSQVINQNSVYIFRKN